MFMLLAASLLVVTGCKKDDKTTEGEKMTFSAGFDNGGAKTEINGLDMSWTEGDAVMINGKTFTADKGGASTTLSGEKTYQEGGLYKAYFPASMWNNGTLTLPATQTYNGTNLSGVNPMYAQSENTSLTFSNLCAMVKIQLTNSNKTVKEIRVSADQPLSGEFEIAESGSNYKAVLKSKTGTACVTLNCGTGVDLSTSNVFYVALPEGDYTNLKFFVVTTDDKGAAIEIASATLQANELYDAVRTPEFKDIVTPISATLTAGCIDCTYTVSGTVEVPSGTHTCEYGVVYSETDDMPTIEEGASKLVVNTETFSGTKNFTVDITKLTEDVKYYVRAYAMIDGTAYSSESTVQTVTYSTPKPLPSTWTNGKNPHPFTVASGKVVYFSQGNLQYNAAGSSATAESGENVGGTWRFAEHQFDFVGDATYGNVYEGGVKCNNENIAQTYGGWIDLFGWGTSGYNHNGKSYQPWSTSKTDVDYYAYGSSSNHLYSSYGTADWGANAISNGVGGSWRTLTGGSSGEWYYLINSRPNAASLYGMGKVGNCTPGVIILPDDWVLPAGLSFTPGTSSWSNVYSYSEWSQMEAAGAVFLPAAGFRYGTSVFNVGSYGIYWSSSYNNGYNAYCLYFYSGNVDPLNGYNRYYGRSARLVSDN